MGRRCNFDPPAPSGPPQPPPASSPGRGTVGSQATPILPSGGASSPAQFPQPSPNDSHSLASLPELQFVPLLTLGNSYSICRTQSHCPLLYTTCSPLPDRTLSALPRPPDPSILTFLQGLPTSGVLTVAHSATPSPPSPPARGKLPEIQIRAGPRGLRHCPD